jgi:hypothetical protein
MSQALGAFVNNTMVCVYVCLDAGLSAPTIFHNHPHGTLVPVTRSGSFHSHPSSIYRTSCIMLALPIFISTGAEARRFVPRPTRQAAVDILYAYLSLPLGVSPCGHPRAECTFLPGILPECGMVIFYMH